MLRRLRIAAAVALLLVLLGIVAFVGMREVYPVRYHRDLLAAAREHGLEPALVAAVVREESRFRPGAISPKGAVGLMQLMPSTAQWVAQAREMEDFDLTQLPDPATNLRMGCWYLSHLIDVFGGSEIMAIAAYNGGVSRVSGWLQTGAWAGTIDDLEMIPTAETREFLRRVEASRRIYRMLYRWSEWE